MIQTCTLGGEPLHALGPVSITSDREQMATDGTPDRSTRTMTLQIACATGTLEGNLDRIDELRRITRDQHQLLVMTDVNAVERLRATVIVTDIETEDPPGDPDLALIVNVTFEFADHSVTGAIGLTYQRDDVGAPVIDLGTSTRWREEYSEERFSDMAPGRRRSAGSVSGSGRLKADLSEEDVAVRRAALEAVKDTMVTELNAAGQGAITRGTFSQMVRISRFTADVDESATFIQWSLDGEYTRLPAEDSGSVVEFDLNEDEDDLNGTVRLAFSGTIRAASEEIAWARLHTLRATYVGSGFIRLSGSARPKTGIGVDDATLVELSFQESYQRAASGILGFTLSIDETEDLRGLTTTTYSGNVTGWGVDEATAWSVAKTQAETLGLGKHPFMTQSQVRRAGRPHLAASVAVASGSIANGVVYTVKGKGTITYNSVVYNQGDRFTGVSGQTTYVVAGGAAVFRAHWVLTVDFSYAYQRKLAVADGGKVYVETRVETSTDAVGEKRTTVSGFIQVPSDGNADTVYAAVRSPYNSKLLLSESKPKVVQQIGSPATTSQTTRYEFSFTVHEAHTATGIRYNIATRKDWAAGTVLTTVSGTVVASSVTQARTDLGTLLTALALGTAIAEDDDESWQKSPLVGGTQSSQWFQLNFSRTYEDDLKDEGTIFACEVAEEIQFATPRLIAKAIPYNVSIIQNMGTEPGRRTVTGSVTGKDEATCEAWAMAQRAAFLDGTYELQPRINKRFTFPKRTSGVARGGGANVRMYVWDFTFSEILLDEAIE